MAQSYRMIHYPKIPLKKLKINKKSKIWEKW